MCKDIPHRYALLCSSPSIPVLLSTYLYLFTVADSRAFRARANFSWFGKDHICTVPIFLVAFTCLSHDLVKYKTARIPVYEYLYLQHYSRWPVGSMHRQDILEQVNLRYVTSRPAYRQQIVAVDAEQLRCGFQTPSGAWSATLRPSNSSTVLHLYPDCYLFARKMAPESAHAIATVWGAFGIW